mgnify:FL=1
MFITDSNQSIRVSMIQCLLLTLFLLFLQTINAQITNIWEKTLNNSGDYGDQYHSVVCDNNNTIYAVGSTVNTNADRDWLIVKYDANANIVWRKSFSAPGLGPDEAKKILIHPNGNLVVTGYGNNKSVGNDFWTMMLNPQGDTLWTKLYNSPTSNLYDEPNAMTIDVDGNIIITGESDQDPSAFLNNDFLTIKYSATGNLLWAVKYNAAANDNDRSMSIATDASSNVYVTGRSFNGTDDDVITIKYNGSGTQQWIKTFDNGGIDRPVSIGIDGQSKIYVAMRSDNGADDDYRIIQYNAQGTQTFNVIYDNVGNDRPVDMVVNSAGGCIVTGRSDSNPAATINYDVKTIAFSSTGVQQWIASFNGLGNNDDIPTHIHLSADGKVVVTGFTDRDNTIAINNDSFVLQYSSTGSNLISQSFNGTANKDDEGHASFISSNGKVVIVGFSSDSNNQRDAHLGIYNANSAPQYQHTLSGIGDNSENVRDLVADANGNVYFCGYTVTKDNNRDFYVGKLNSSGNLLWANDTTGTLFGSDEEANAIAIDASGNIIVSGFLKNAGTSSDIYVEKYNANGTLLWNFGYDNAIHESDRSYAMSTDAAGNIYLAGKKDTDASWQVNDDINTIKINSNGTLGWAASYTSSTLLDRAQFIQVTSTNEIIVGGRIQNGVNDDVIVLKYNSTGNLVWSKTVDVQGANDKLNDLKIDASGNVYLCGQSQISANSNDYDAFACKINSAGAQAWMDIYQHAGEGLDEAVSIELGNNGDVWYAGHIDINSDITEKFNILLRHLDNNANILNTNNELYSNSNSVVADDLVLNEFNEPCISAHKNVGQSGDNDYELNIISYDGISFTNQYTRSISDSIDIANVMKYYPNNGSIFIGGSTWNTSGQRDLLIGKYNWLPIQIIENENSELSVYPNPCKDFIHVVGLEKPTYIKIINVAGELVYAEPNTGSTIDTRFLDSGIYFLEFSTPQKTWTEKIIKE